MNIVDRAMHIALQAHFGVVNKHDGEPYILHLHRVFMDVRDRGLSEEHQAVAWLHDTVEDTTVTVDELIRAFPLNPDIPLAVSLLTKVKGIDNEAYYRLVVRNPMAADVKRSDLEDNFRRNHLIEDEPTRARMARKYSLGMDILKGG